jgi:hypothetical protein
MSNYLQENIYYNSTRLNTTSAQIPAEQDDRLLNPIISNAMNFNLAINQAKIPISSIPLTQSNIDLHAYEVTLQDTVNGELVSASAFAPQVNAKSGSFLYNYATTGVITKYSYNQTTGALTTLSSINVNASITGVTQMVVDQFENYYLINADTLVVVNQANNVLNTLNFESSQLQSIAIDPVETIYLAVESSETGSSVNVYQNDNSATTCTLALVQSITQGPNGVPLSAINTVCADDNIIVGYEANKFAIYDATNYALGSSFVEPTITQLGRSSQTLAGSDSFCVIDNGNINNIFLGFPTGGSSTELQNLIGDAPWLTTATPFAGKSAYFNGTGYIIGTDNNTYKYTPYNVAGSAPSLLSSSSPISTGGVVQAGNQQGFVGKEASTTNLLGYETNNLSSTLYKQLADDFLISTGLVSISVFDIQNTTNDIFAIGTDNNLYESTLPFFPKQLLIGSVANPSVSNTGLSQIGFSWNEVDTTNSPSGFINSVNIPKGSNADVIDYGCAIPNDGYAYILRADSVTGQVIVGQFQFPNLNITAGATIPNISTSATSYAFAATIIAGTTWWVMSDNTQTIYLEKNDFTGQVTFQLEDIPQVGGQGNIQLATYIQGGQNYVAITNGDKIYVYDITNPSAVVNVLNYQLTIAGVPVASAITWANGSIYAMIGPDSALYQLTYTIGGGGTFTVNSVTNIIDDLPINALINCLSSNEIQQEVYILQTSTNTPVAVISTSTLALTSNFSMPTTVDTTVSRYIASLPNLNTFYGNGMWTQVTTASNLVTSIAISKNNPNNFYLVYDSNSLVYKGVYTPAYLGPPSVANLTRYAPITSTVTQISAAIPEINGSYQSKVFAFTISTQTPLANSPISYGSTQISSISCNRYESVTAPAITQTYGISKFGIGVDYINANDAAFLVSSTLPTANGVFILSGGDIDAGPVNIYDMIVVVNAVNAALLEAWGKLTGGYGSTYSAAPVLSLDYNTGYLTLSYPAAYVTQKPSSIIFNTALLTIAYFYNTPTSDNNGGYIILPTGSTSITQTSKTLYIFNQLDQLLFETQSLFVQGTYFSLVSTSRIITDIGVDTSAIINNIGEKVIYNPFILRSFKMNSNLPVSRVHMRILYQYKDGSVYPLLLNPGENFFVKINFVSKV